MSLFFGTLFLGWHFYFLSELSLERFLELNFSFDAFAEYIYLMGIMLILSALFCFPHIVIIILYFWLKQKKSSQWRLWQHVSATVVFSLLISFGWAWVLRGLAEEFAIVQNFVAAAGIAGLLVELFLPEKLVQLRKSSPGF